MPRFNKLIFCFMITACFIIVSFLFIVDSFGSNYVSGPILRMKSFAVPSILLFFGVCGLYFGEQVAKILLLPTSFKALNRWLKEELASVRSSCKKRLSDINIAGFLFCAAVIVASSYAQVLMASGVIGPFGIADPHKGAIISQTTYMHVPIAAFSLKIIQTLSSVIPFITSYSVLFSVSIVLLYSIFRIGMGRVISLICALSLMVSSIQLDHIVPFWDKYTIRAPIVYSLVLIMGLLVTRAFKPIRTIGCAILAGIVLGHGLMFRPDLMVFAVIFILTILFFTPRSPIITLKVKLLSVLFFTLSTLFSFSTCLSCGLKSPSTGHAFINGSTPFYNDRIGLTRPNYDWNYLLLDFFTSSMSFAQESVFEENNSYTGYGPVDEQTKLIITNFPANILARFYGAALRSMEIPFTYVLQPAAVTNETILSVYAGRGVVLNSLAGLGSWLWVASLLMISFCNLRKGIFCMFLLPPLVLLPFTAFLGYYFFYLEFISYWALGFVVQHILVGVVGLTKLQRDSELSRRVLSPRSWWNSSSKGVVYLALATVSIILGPLIIFRYYQNGRVSNLLHQYDTVATDPIKLKTVPLLNDNVLLTNNQLFIPMPIKDFHIEELMASFDTEKCNYPTVWITLRYGDEKKLKMDFSRSMSIDLSSSKEGQTRLFFPAIFQKDIYSQGHSSYFSGIEISRDQAACLNGLHRVRDLRHLDMLLTLQLPLEKGSSYARLRDWETEPNYTVPEKMSTATIARRLSQPLKPITAVDVDFQNPIFSFVNDEKNKDSTYWKVDGYAKDNRRMHTFSPKNWRLGEISYVNSDGLLVNTDLMITKPKWHRKGSAFVAQGTLYSGGVFFVLLNENRPSGTVSITNPGKFNVVIEPPKDGIYTVGLMNYVARYNTLENRMIATAGWVE